jgi:hypothetical protein
MYGNAPGGDVAYSRVQLRFGKNEALYRSVNDSIAEINKVSEYEAVRANARTFMVYPGHVTRGAEHVVRGNERFIVVEKLGVSAEVAETTSAR